jgi:hypothetical protein
LVLATLLVLMSAMACWWCQSRVWEIVGATEFLVGCFLFWRLGLRTELACYASWVVALCGLYLLPALVGRLADRPDWDSHWQDGTLLMTIVPGSASFIVLLLRLCFEPQVGGDQSK